MQVISPFDEEEFWYLATMYDKHPEGHDAAHDLASKAAALCLENGVGVFCPITHSYGIKHFAKEWDYNIALGLDQLFLNKAKGLIVLCKPTEWTKSLGIEHEINYMREHDKPVIFWYGDSTIKDKVGYYNVALQEKF